MITAHEYNKGQKNFFHLDEFIIKKLVRYTNNKVTNAVPLV